MLGCSSCHTLVCVCAHPWVIVRYLLAEAMKALDGKKGDRGVLPDRSVHTWYGTDGSLLVSRVATPNDDTGEQARSVNLLETWGLVSRRGQRGNPLANGQYSSLVAKLAVDKTVGSSLTVLGSCRKTGISPGIHGIANDWITGFWGEWAQCTVWPQ